MSTDVSTVLIAFMVAVISPLMLQALLGHQAHNAKEEDWARQDAIAAKADLAAAKAQEAAAIAAEQRIEVAARAEEAKMALAATNVRAAEDAEEIKGQLVAIHAFVNGSMTEALKAQLVALQGQLGLINASHPEMRELAASIETQIAELESTLEERAQQQKIADAAAAKARSAVQAIDNITQAQLGADVPPPEVNT